MLARRSYSSRSARQNADVHASSSRSAIAGQGRLSPTHLPSTIRSGPIAIPTVLTTVSTHVSTTVSGPLFSWDTETLVDDNDNDSDDDDNNDDSTSPDPTLFTAPAASQESHLTARAEISIPRGQPQQQSAPIVYGNGHWILHPKPNKSTIDKSLAQQHLASILRGQPAAGSSAIQSQRSAKQKQEFENEQIALVKRMLVEMGYSYARQRTLKWDELSVTEQHALLERIVEEIGSNAIRRVEERRAEQEKLRRESWSADDVEGCCRLREWKSGAVCERCMMWEGDGWMGECFCVKGGWCFVMVVLFCFGFGHREVVAFLAVFAVFLS